RQGGDRSGTLIENYAPGMTGLQSASPLAMRDLASHVRIFFTGIEGDMYPCAVAEAPKTLGGNFGFRR
ncbi:hypothetical protein, partial [Candidatus Mycobacterium methanotrophicum]|uniref:hypothetical protein n=1 Tax=Candidatus Mycobacterium methanotrophicum TaxID=2943498 RepID=UPI001C575C91